MPRLRREALKRLRKHDFERFVCQLLFEERRRRFAPGAVEIAPPAEEDDPDGGRDMLAEIDALPEPGTASDWDLLPNRLGQVWYSCKSERDDGDEAARERGSWRTQVRAELDPSPRIIDARSAKPFVVPKPERLIEQSGKRAPPRLLLEALVAGGSYYIITNVAPSKTLEFRLELALLFEFWIRRELDCEVAPDELRKRIRVIGADELAERYNTRPFTLAPEFEELLELGEPEFLLSWSSWTRALEAERRRMAFVPDRPRSEYLRRIAEFVGPAGRAEPVLRFCGAPGVGKTRLVHQGLVPRRDIQARVRFTQDVGQAIAWLNGHGLEGYGDVILVVDEVVAESTGSLAHAFMVAKGRGPDARLIIVGPLAKSHRGEPEPILLGALADEQLRAIVGKEIRSSSNSAALVDRVAELSEGYPLFALWLAKALDAEPELLRAPGAKLSGGHDPWQAVAAVLVGPPSGEFDHWRAQASLRAKALLLTLLASDELWDDFDPIAEGEFARALEVASFHELLEAARACEDRGLLRRVGRRSYISPANLERMLLNHLFGGGPNPPLSPRRVRKSLPTRYPRLLERARLVGADDVCRKNLAQATFADAIGPELLRAPDLSEAAFTLPEQAAFAIASVARANSFELLPRALVFVLKHLSHRAISPGAFAAIEDSMWRLAPLDHQLAEAWAQLFLPVGATHQTFEYRFGLLRRRLADADAIVRERALAGLRAASSLHYEESPLVVGLDDVDAPWEPRTWTAFFERVLSARRELLARSNDAEPRVAAAARRLWCHVGLGDEPSFDAELLGPLTAALRSWSSVERSRLADALWGPDGVEPDQHEPGSRWRAFAEALVPRDFGDRLVAQVGSWMPDVAAGEYAPALSGKVQPGDEQLADEILAEPELLLGQLDWLNSSEAVRVSAFAKALGAREGGHNLLTILLNASAPARAPRLVAGYLAGWGRVDEAAFDAWIAAHLARSEWSTMLAEALVGASGSDRRATMLLSLLDDGGVDTSALLQLGYSDWAVGVSDSLLDSLAIALAKLDEEAQFQALGLMARRLSRSTEGFGHDARAAIAKSATITLLGATAHGQLPAQVERAWSELITALVRLDESEALTSALVQALSSNFVGYPHHLVAAFRQMLGRGETAALWQVIRSALERGAPAAGMREILERAGFFASFDPAAMLEWVGDDAQRGRKAAEFATPGGATLDGFTVELLHRFGADSEPGRVLQDRALATARPGVRDRQLIDHARAWQRERDPAVRAWAAEVEARAGDLVERDRAERNYLRRWG